jgi:hypothetical protein
MKQMVGTVHHWVVFGLWKGGRHCLEIGIILPQQHLQRGGIENKGAFVTVGSDQSIDLPPVAVRSAEQACPRGLVFGRQQLPGYVNDLVRQGVKRFGRQCCHLKLFSRTSPVEINDNLQGSPPLFCPAGDYTATTLIEP